MTETNLMQKHAFLTISAFESPKMAFSPTLHFILKYHLGESVKLGKMEFWGFQGQKWQEIHVFTLNIVSVICGGAAEL